MINVSANFRGLAHKLHKMKERGEDLEPAFEAIGDILVASIDRNFSEEGRHSGDPDSIWGGDLKWDPWSKNWRERRRKMGKVGKILTLDGGLVSSIDYTADSDELILSSGKKYAARMHFGGKGVPARPFMVIQEEDKEEMFEVLSHFMVSGDKS